MQKHLLLVSFLLFVLRLSAQTDTAAPEAKPPKLWKKQAEFGLNMNQASFSGNWKGGGVNAIALGSLFNGRALYESKKISFDNNVQLLYGFQKTALQGYRKTNDKIYLDTKIGYKISPKWDMYAGVNFLSQFAPGFKYGTDSIGRTTQQKISEFLAPGYLTSTLGWEYKPRDYFWIRFGVGGFRKTFTIDTTLYHNVPENYGVAVHKKVKNELDFVMALNFDKDLGKNINLQIKATTFTNYANIRVTDMRTDIVLTGKINKFMNANISATALYFQAQDYHIQYSQSIAIGLSYKFNEFDEKP